MNPRRRTQRLLNPMWRCDKGQVPNLPLLVSDPAILGRSHLAFRVMDEDLLTKDDPIGYGRMWLGPLASAPLKIGDWSFSSSSLITNPPPCFTNSPVLFHNEAEEMSMTGTVWLPDVLVDAGWHVKRSRNTGVLYYANSQTNVCQWDRPAEPKPPPGVAPTAGGSSSEESESDTTLECPPGPPP